MSGGLAQTRPNAGSGPLLGQAGPGLPGLSGSNTAVLFTGQAFSSTATDSLRMTNSTAAFGNDYTYQIWVYNTRVTGGSLITGYIGGRYVQTGQATDAFGIWGNLSGGSPGQLFTIDGAGNALGTSATLAKDTWYNVAFTRSGSTVSLYVNGSSVGSFTSALGSPATAPNSQFFVAASRQDGTWGFEGRLDEVSLTNRALTAAEIKATYNAALYPTVYWSGSSGIWSTGDAWSTTSGSFTSADAGAGGGQDAVFSLAADQTIRLNGDQRVNSFTFSSSGSSVLLGGTTGTPAATRCNWAPPLTRAASRSTLVPVPSRSVTRRASVRPSTSRLPGTRPGRITPPTPSPSPMPSRAWPPRARNLSRSLARATRACSAQSPMALPEACSRC